MSARQDLQCVSSGENAALVTGYKRPYTESRLALTLDEVEQHKHELERLGCKNVRVLKVPI